MVMELVVEIMNVSQKKCIEMLVKNTVFDNEDIQKGSYSYHVSNPDNTTICREIVLCVADAEM